jgi:hypothetical protein
MMDPTVLYYCSTGLPLFSHFVIAGERERLGRSSRGSKFKYCWAIPILRNGSVYPSSRTSPFPTHDGILMSYESLSLAFRDVLLPR